MDRDEFMDLVYETFADEPDNVLANGIIEAADAYVEYEKAQLSNEDATKGATSDLIERQQAIDAVMEYGAIWMEYTDAMDKGEIAQRALNNAKSTMIRILKELPSVQPERAIPLSWIENEIKWLKSLDNTFSEITALQISAMVNKWRDEQNETD